MADSSSWRDTMPRDDRVKVCQHIMGKLGAYYRSVPEAALKEKTSAFESQAFQRATSRRDYLEKIAEGLSKVESQARQSSHTTLAAAMHPQQAPTADGAAGIQAQAVLRQQLHQQAQQQAQQQQARLQQRHLARQQLQQQIHLQAQQRMLQQRQQQQQHASPHQQAQPGVAKQEPTRKGSASSKRQSVGPEGKKKGSSGSSKSGTAAAAVTTAAGRGKSQSVNHSGANDAEAPRRRNQIAGNKQAAFSAGQGNMNPSMTNNEYIMALARQRQSPATAQPAHSAAQMQGSQHSQHSQGVPSGIQVSQVQQSQQTLSHGQQQPPRVQDPQTSTISQQARHQLEGMATQNMNAAGSVPVSGMMMDGAGGTGNAENHRQLAVAALAATAAVAGVGITPEHMQNLTPEQIKHVLSVTRSQRMNFGNVGNASAPNASATQNMGNWMGQFANPNGARGSNPAVHHSHALSQALAFEKQKQLQEARQHQLQNVSAQAGAAGVQGKHGVHNVAVSAAAAGVTVNQMNAIMAKEKAKIDKSGGTPQQKQAALAEAFQAASRARASQAIHGNGQMQMTNGGTSSGVTAAAAASAAAATVGVSSAAMSNVQRASVSGSGDDAEFWIKLQDMQTKYKQSLLKLFPIIRKLQERQPASNQELFMKHLKDCFNILNLQRSATIPPRLTTLVLDRAERFIDRVVSAYSKYLKDMVKSATTTDPARRAKLVAQIDNCTGVVAPGQHALPGQNIQNQQAGRVHAQVAAQAVKTDATLPQGVPSQLDPQQQQFARFHSQQVQLQQKQQLRLPKQRVAQLPMPQQSLPSAQAQGAGTAEGIPGYPQHSQQMLSQTQAQRPTQAATLQGTGSESSKTAGKGVAAKGSVGRGRTSSAKTGRNTLGLPVSRGNIPGAMQNQAQVQARTEAQVQAQVAAQVQVQQAQAAAAAQAQASAAQQAAAQAQAAQAQAQAQALTQNQAAQSRVQQIRAHQAAQRTLQSRNQKLSQMRQQVPPGRVPPQPSVPHGVRHSAANGAVSTWNGQHPGQARLGNGVAPGAPPVATRLKRSELTIQQRIQEVESAVKEAVDQSQRLEGYVDTEMKRAKSERIQNTLAALRNIASVKSAVAGKGKGTKRQASLVDVDNFGEKDGVIKSKTVFECSSEAGLRLAKRPKNEAQDLKSLREAVEADCKAAQERNPLLLIEIIEEFGQPVVTCLLRITEIKLPKLVLRVQRGYPRKGGATYGFERPSMGWVGVLDEIRSRFKRALATAPAASVGVAAFLDAWAREADAVINGSLLTENR